MCSIASFKRLVFMMAFVFLLGATVQANEPDAIAFSGQVKKVILKKNKVAVVDPVTKKRFTLIVDDKTNFSGWMGIADIKKGEAITGEYVVTDKGLYIATKLQAN